jgi:phosphotriesterase-related protein
MIRTVTGDIAPANLGMTYPHEHLLTQPGAHVTDRDLEMDSEAAAIKELMHFRAAGGHGIVEMTTRDYGRKPEGLRRVAEATDTAVVCVTGFIKDASLRPFVENRSISDIADEMIREVEDGIDGTSIRAGVIKAGSSRDKITDAEEKVFRAAAIAHKETGAPISTHTEAGTMGLEQVALLRSEGVSPERILIGHCDRRMDIEYHMELAQTGAILGYDQFSKEKYYPDSLRIEFLVRLVKAGFGKQVILSADMARKSYWTSYGGGPGLTFVLWRIVPWLHSEGLTREETDQMLIETPRRLLTIQKEQ